MEFQVSNTRHEASNSALVQFSSNLSLLALAVSSE